MTTKQNQSGNAIVKESVDKLVMAFRDLDTAITPRGTAGGHDDTGGYVTSLTEAVMGVTAGLCKIAAAIDGLSQAVRDTTDNDR